ncbi:MAG: septal ring lytic transglycosylase RlpA family protein [Longimonas sp.]|uniref:septal ring lytic transglycosylase RlpA family protein n=1 Tax=Longimonas sp. TaxID=2039626 RepID=UPI003976ECBF
MAHESGATATGMASYYADKFDGRTTANGETFDNNAYTAAHRTLPFGTRVRVTRTDTGDQVTVRINDRGPFVDGRIIDLSQRAARDIDMLADGLAEVRIEVVDEGDESPSDEAPADDDSDATSW